MPGTSRSTCPAGSSGSRVVRPPSPTATAGTTGEACPECARTFSSRRGLGVHRQKAHPAQYSQDVVLPTLKVRWSTEELRLMARREAEAILQGVKFLNQFLQLSFPERSLESVKGVRRRTDYKAFVEAALCAIRSQPLFGSSQSGSSESEEEFFPAVAEPALAEGHTEEHTPAEVTGSALVTDLRQAVRDLLAETVVPGEGFNVELLRSAAVKALDGCDVSDELVHWLRSCFPSAPFTPRLRPSSGVLGRCRKGRSKRSKKFQRRQAYARTQSMWRKDRARAAHEVLDGGPKRGAHDLDSIQGFWAPLLQSSAGVGVAPPLRRAGSPITPQSLLGPISVSDVQLARVAVRSAAGPDHISARVWNAVPPLISALFYNIILLNGKLPGPLKDSRTVFIPKSDLPGSPGEYRPISVVSVVVRHLHKILAARLNRLDLFDPRQRAFVSGDGVAENLLALDALLTVSRSSLREVHLVTLDIMKAFDSLDHGAIKRILTARGFSECFISYIMSGYEGATTTFEVGGRSGDGVTLRRGVRQGDPLSPLIFNLAVDEILASIPEEVGFLMEGERVSCLGFADDLVVITSSRVGMREALKCIEEAASGLGLKLNPHKCSALSVIPDGHAKKLKILDEPQFQIGGSYISQSNAVTKWKYLGIDFDPRGAKVAEVEVSGALENLTHAPLKPQQRMVILRTFLVPRFIHGLVLGNITSGRLRQLDRQVRRSVRAWLRLPKDTAVGYFHAPIKDGGLGISSFETLIPELTVRRVRRLRTSVYPVARAAFQTRRLQRKLSWGEKVLAKLDISLEGGQGKYWSARLHASVDGYELRESSRTPGSTRWLATGSAAVPGRDFVQHVHVHSGSLPTRIRTSRGERRAAISAMCRAGCLETETASHVIQRCFRTHGGRILRHDAVCRLLAQGLQDKDWVVEHEPHVKTSIGLRKPDLIAKRGQELIVVDTQIVSGARQLNALHAWKRSYYADIPDLADKLSVRYGTPAKDIVFSTATISWRGIWSSRSYADLISFGIPPGILNGVVTRVLQGSHTNWTRFNRMTTIAPARAVGRQVIPNQ